jgi:hypothetical protein
MPHHRRRPVKDSGGDSLRGRPAPVLLLALALMAGPAGLLPSGVHAAGYDGAALPPRDAAGNYTLGAGDSWHITSGDVVINGTLILAGNASLGISGGGSLTVNGNLWASGRSSINISGAALRVNVPDHPPERIERLYSSTNGFVLVEEEASVNLVNAELAVARMQRALMRGAVSPGFGDAGQDFTFRVTYTDPNNRPATSLQVVIDGTAFPMSKLEPDDENSRDGIAYVFSCATLDAGNHTYHFGGAGPDGPLRYPASGEIPGPSVGVGEETYEVSSAIITCFGRIVSESSTLSLGSTLYAPMNAILLWNHTHLTSSVTMEVNPTCLFRSCTIPAMAAIQKIGLQTLSFEDCKIGTALVNGANNARFERCTIDSLDCQSDSRTTVVDSTVASFRSGQNASCTLDGTDVTAAIPGFPSMRIIAQSQVSALNGTRAGSVELSGAGILRLGRSSAGSVNASGRSSLLSEYSAIGAWALSDNATLTKTKLLNTAINGSAAAADIELVSADTGAPVVSGRTGADGRLGFTVPVTTFGANRTTETGNVTVRASYRELSTSLALRLQDDGSEINLTLADRAPPAISRVVFDHYLPGSGEALVGAVAGDAGGCGVKSVVLAYSIDGGKWVRRPMIGVGNNSYEGTIPGLGRAGRVQFKVTASDWLDNTAESGVEARQVGSNDWTLAAVLGAVLLIGAFGAGFLIARRRRG